MMKHYSLWAFLWADDQRKNCLSVPQFWYKKPRCASLEAAIEFCNALSLNFPISNKFSLLKNVTYIRRDIPLTTELAVKECLAKAIEYPKMNHSVIRTKRVKVWDNAAGN